MQLLNELIDLLGRDSARIQDALIKAQILAHKLGDPELKSWVEHELRGYPEDAEIPAYRVVRVALIGHVTNGYYHYSNLTLPLGHISPEVRRKIEYRELRQSVSVLEEWAGASDDNIGISISPEACSLFSQALTEDYHVQQAWGRFGVGSILQVVTQVRSRLLEFCLVISDRFPSSLTEDQVLERAEQMSSSDIFRNAVFGDNVNIVVGAGRIESINNTVVKNDLESLLHYFRGQGVSPEDVENLRAAVAADEDSGAAEKRDIGPMVRGWIGSMVAKAGSAGWNVSLEAAGNLLAAAIGAYYGFGSK